MNIIFKMLSYLKKNITTIKVCIIICIVGLIVLNVLACKMVKENKQLKTTINKLSSCNEVLEQSNEKLTQEISSLQASIKNKDEEIKSKEEEINKLNEELTTINKSKKVNKSGTISKTVNTATKYSEATILWNYFKSQGLSDYVCAGILGNIMAEVGGQTLDFSRYSTKHNGNYYGICQWTGSRKTRLLNNYGSSIEAQAEFLVVELYEIIPKTNSFYSMTNEKECALYFAKYFERCSSKSYSVRQTNATKAYNYFVS